MVTNQLERPRALTMRPPWGTAIVHLGKDVENRTWGTTWRGELYIHQGHTFSEHGMHDQRVRTAYSALVDRDVEVMPYSVLPQGVILGRATLVDCHRAERRDTCCGVWADRVHDDLDGPARHRLVHWRLENVKALDVPVPCRGGQGLWRLDDDVAAQVDELLAVPRARRRAPAEVTFDRLQRHIARDDLTPADRTRLRAMLDELTVQR